MASLLAVFIAMLMHTLFPTLNPPATTAWCKACCSNCHETLMGGITATLSFVVFQCLTSVIRCQRKWPPF